MPAQPGSRRRIYGEEPFDGSSPHKPVDPHSEWQVKIEDARAEKGLSFRKLAELSKIPAGNLFNWLRSAKGTPSRTAYSSSVNNRLATALGIDPEELADAYNKSAFKPVDPNTPDPAPRAPRPGPQENLPGDPESLRGFLGALKATRRPSFSISELETMAAMFLPPAAESKGT